MEAKKFSRNPGQFKWVTRETRCYVSIAELLIRNLMSQVGELFRRPRAILEILYFSGDRQFFPKLPGIRFLYDQGKELFHLLTGRQNLRPGRHLKQSYRSGSYRGTSQRGTWAGCKNASVFHIQICRRIRQSLWSIIYI